MRIIRTKTFYLEMRSPCQFDLATPCDGVEAVRVSRPSLEYYRYLYRTVGGDFQWVDRLLMADDDLRAIIHDPRVEVFVLKLAGDEAGYAELDRRQDGQIELSYFGLFPQFIGQGLGKYFLEWTIRTAWSYAPSRVWVHTCDLDHEAALPNYLKAGFELYDEKIIDQVVPNQDSATGGSKLRD